MINLKKLKRLIMNHHKIFLIGALVYIDKIQRMIHKLFNQTDKKSPFENFSMAFPLFFFIFHSLLLS